MTQDGNGQDSDVLSTEGIGFDRTVFTGLFSVLVLLNGTQSGEDLAVGLNG